MDNAFIHAPLVSSNLDGASCASAWYQGSKQLYYKVSGTVDSAQVQLAFYTDHTCTQRASDKISITAACATPGLWQPFQDLATRVKQNGLSIDAGKEVTFTCLAAVHGPPPPPPTPKVPQNKCTRHNGAGNGYRFNCSNLSGCWSDPTDSSKCPALPNIGSRGLDIWGGDYVAPYLDLGSNQLTLAKPQFGINAKYMWSKNDTYYYGAAPRGYFDNMDGKRGKHLVLAFTQAMNVGALSGEQTCQLAWSGHTGYDGASSPAFNVLGHNGYNGTLPGWIRYMRKEFGADVALSVGGYEGIPLPACVLNYFMLVHTNGDLEQARKLAFQNCRLPAAGVLRDVRQDSNYGHYDFSYNARDGLNICLQLYKIVRFYDFRLMDFDIEGAYPGDNEFNTAVNSLWAFAMQQVQASLEYSLRIRLTLAMFPTGLPLMQSNNAANRTQEWVKIPFDDQGNVVQKSARKGVDTNLLIINSMAMDYDPGDATDRSPQTQGLTMGAAAVLSGLSLASQLVNGAGNMDKLYEADSVWDHIAITPMIGIQDGCCSGTGFDIENWKAMHQFSATAAADFPQDGIDSNFWLLTMKASAKSASEWNNVCNGIGDGSGIPYTVKTGYVTSLTPTSQRVCIQPRKGYKTSSADASWRHFTGQGTATHVPWPAKFTRWSFWAISRDQPGVFSAGATWLSTSTLSTKWTNGTRSGNSCEDDSSCRRALMQAEVLDFSMEAVKAHFSSNPAYDKKVHNTAPDDVSLPPANYLLPRCPPNPTNPSCKIGAVSLYQSTAQAADVTSLNIGPPPRYLASTYYNADGTPKDTSNAWWHNYSHSDKVVWSRDQPLTVPVAANSGGGNGANACSPGWTYLDPTSGGTSSCTTTCAPDVLLWPDNYSTQAKVCKSYNDPARALVYNPGNYPDSTSCTYTASPGQCYWCCTGSQGKTQMPQSFVPPPAPAPTPAPTKPPPKITPNNAAMAACKACVADGTTWVWGKTSNDANQCAKTSGIGNFNQRVGSKNQCGNNCGCHQCEDTACYPFEAPPPTPAPQPGSKGVCASGIVDSAVNQLCIAGQYMTVHGCKYCPAGKYNSVAQATSCKLCSVAPPDKPFIQSGDCGAVGAYKDLDFSKTAPDTTACLALAATNTLATITHACLFSCQFNPKNNKWVGFHGACAAGGLTDATSPYCHQCNVPKSGVLSSGNCLQAGYGMTLGLNSKCQKCGTGTFNRARANPDLTVCTNCNLAGNPVGCGGGNPGHEAAPVTESSSFNPLYLLTLLLLIPLLLKASNQMHESHNDNGFKESELVKI